MEFVCKRCGYETLHHHSLIRHLRRKHPCKATLSDISIDDLLTEQTHKEYNEITYDCDRCNRKFNTRQSRHRHMKICQGNMTSMEEMKKEIEALKKEISTQGKGQTNNATIGTINNGLINNGTIINVNGLGKEDISYLTEHPRFQTFMIKCIREKSDGIMDYLERKHFDPSHPENHNLKKMRRDDFIEVYDGKKWRLRFKEDVLDDVFEHMQRDFANFIEEAFADNGDLKKKIIDNFMESVGKPLNWDLSCGDYEYDGEINEEKRKELQNKIYKLALEHIYIKSKEVHEIA